MLLLLCHVQFQCLDDSKAKLGIWGKHENMFSFKSSKFTKRKSQFERSYLSESFKILKIFIFAYLKKWKKHCFALALEAPGLGWESGRGRAESFAPDPLEIQTIFGRPRWKIKSKKWTKLTKRRSFPPFWKKPTKNQKKTYVLKISSNEKSLKERKPWRSFIFVLFP